MAPLSKDGGAIFPEGHMSDKTCRGCGIEIYRYRQTDYCKKCVNTAKECEKCKKPIAAFNRLGLCGECRIANRKERAAAAKEENFDWWEDR